MVLAVSEGAEHDGGVRFGPGCVGCPLFTFIVYKMQPNPSKRSFGKGCDNWNMVLGVSEGAERDGSVCFAVGCNGYTVTYSYALDLAT